MYKIRNTHNFNLQIFALIICGVLIYFDLDEIFDLLIEGLGTALDYLEVFGHIILNAVYTALVASIFNWGVYFYFRFESILTQLRLNISKFSEKRGEAVWSLDGLIIRTPKFKS